MNQIIDNTEVVIARTSEVLRGQSYGGEVYLNWSCCGRAVSVLSGEPARLLYSGR